MRICVVGAGSWGTALASVIADGNHEVSIWVHDENSVSHINENHRNPKYLSDAILSEKIIATNSIEEATFNIDACVFVTPSKYLRGVAEEFSDYIDDNLPILICSKGVEENTGFLQSQIIEDVLGNVSRIAVLSGPNHAEEVINRIPSGAVCASLNDDTAMFFRNLCATRYFRTYTSKDVVGVELCAAFKNVIAIAVGVSYGLGMGDNTAAMLITRGLAEMSRMVHACGGQAMTCLGLAGAGDMVVTCMSRHSRNRRFGQDYVACGKTLEEFEHDTHMVVEGAIACKTLDILSKKHGTELPITEAIRAIIWEGASPTETAKALVDRPLKEEFYGVC